MTWIELLYAGAEPAIQKYSEISTQHIARISSLKTRNRKFAFRESCHIYCRHIWLNVSHSECYIRFWSFPWQQSLAYFIEVKKNRILHLSWKKKRKLHWVHVVGYNIQYISIHCLLYCIIKTQSVHYNRTTISSYKCALCIGCFYTYTVCMACEKKKILMNCDRECIQWFCTACTKMINLTLHYSYSKILFEKWNKKPVINTVSVHI